MLRAARAVAAVREPVRSQRFACAALATACVATAVFSQQIAGFPHGSTVSAFLFARDGDLPRGMPLGNNEESEMSKLRSMVVGSALAIASVASAQNAVEWRVADGGNGHWYAAADAPTGDAAVSLAASLGGNLATISDAAENAHVHAIYIATGKQSAWLGLRQLNGQPSPNAGWHWITGEPYSYLNWTDHSGAFPTGAPDDSPCGLPPWGIENDQANQGVMNPDGRWDDLETGMPTCGSPQWNNTAIIEWSADCNNDGIVDYGQILAGALADANQNNIPDCCEAGSSCPGSAVQWRVEDGGNGHWYQLSGPFFSSWVLGNSYAEEVGGHLVTLTSASEQTFAATLAFNSTPTQVDDCWLGAFQDHSAPTYSEPAGGWRWVTGESWNFTSWRPDGQPHGNGDFLVATTVPADGLGWVDSGPNHRPGNCQAFVEWSADCNNDSLIDYGQIRAGDLIDANANNIPDCCEPGASCDPCPADVDQSGAINGVDLAGVLNNWGTSGGKQPRSDINHDGLVNAADLAEVLNAWGPCQ